MLKVGVAEGFHLMGSMDLAITVWTVLYEGYAESMGKRARSSSSIHHRLRLTVSFLVLAFNKTLKEDSELGPLWRVGYKPQILSE